MQNLRLDLSSLQDLKSDLQRVQNLRSDFKVSPFQYFSIVLAGNSTRRSDSCQMMGQPKHEVSERSWRPELGRKLLTPTVQ